MNLFQILMPKLRMTIRAELRQLQKKLGITTIYVTHDQGEALALSDKIAVINKGKILQYGTSQEIYFTPSDEFTAKFIGTTNILEGSVSHEGGNTFFRKDEYQIEIPDKYKPGSGKLCIRPEMIEISEKDEGGVNTFKGRILNYIFEGAYIRYWIDSLGLTFVVDQYNPGYQGILDGEVYISLDPQKLHMLQDANH